MNCCECFLLIYFLCTWAMRPLFLLKLGEISYYECSRCSWPKQKNADPVFTQKKCRSSFLGFGLTFTGEPFAEGAIYDLWANEAVDGIGPKEAQEKYPEVSSRLRNSDLGFCWIQIPGRAGDDVLDRVRLPPLFLIIFLPSVLLLFSMWWTVLLSPLHYFNILFKGNCTLPPEV